MATSSERAEESVRRYLAFLKNPESLVDEVKVARAQSKVERTANGDSVEHLLALAALERAQVVDADPIVDAFVRALPAWTEEHGVSVSVLLSFGVPGEVLVKARLLSRDRLRRLRTAERGDTPRPPRPAKKDTTIEPPAELPAAAASNGHGSLAGGINYDAIVKRLPPTGTSWMATDLAKLLNVSPLTARNRIATMRGKGLVRHVGEVSPWTEKGTPPHLYERV